MRLQVFPFIHDLILCLGQAVEKCGGVDILVSNAAVNPFFGNMMDSTEEVWDKVQSTDKARRPIYTQV